MFRPTQNQKAVPDSLVIEITNGNTSSAEKFLAFDACDLVQHGVGTSSGSNITISSGGSTDFYNAIRKYLQGAALIIPSSSANKGVSSLILTASDQQVFDSLNFRRRQVDVDASDTSQALNASKANDQNSQNAEVRNFDYPTVIDSMTAFTGSMRANSSMSITMAIGGITNRITPGLDLSNFMSG
jgi:hypothetical protein